MGDTLHGVRTAMEKQLGGGRFFPLLRQAMDQEVTAPALSQIVVLWWAWGRQGETRTRTLKEAHVARVQGRRHGERRSHRDGLWLLPIRPLFAPDEYFDLV